MLNENYVDEGVKARIDRNYADQPEVQQSVIRSQYGELENGLTELRQRLDTLEHKLEPVLEPLPDLTTTGDAGEPNRKSMSPFAANICSDSSRVRQLIQQVSNIIDRLEV